MSLPGGANSTSWEGKFGLVAVTAQHSLGSTNLGLGSCKIGGASIVLELGSTGFRLDSTAFGMGSTSMGSGSTLTPGNPAPLPKAIAGQGGCLGARRPQGLRRSHVS